MSSRIRFRVIHRDGSLTTNDEACVPQNGNVPFPRGSNVAVSIVHDDGSETPLNNVKSATIKIPSRTEMVVATVEFYAPVIDIEVPIENAGITNSADPGDGFLGSDRGPSHDGG